MKRRVWAIALAAAAVCLACSGSDGDTGPRGPRGEDGVPGEPGQPGKVGPKGKDGKGGAEEPPGPVRPPPTIASIHPLQAAQNTIVTIRGANFDPEGGNEVWVDGHKAKVLSTSETQLRITGFPGVELQRTAALTVIANDQASNGHMLTLVPRGAFEVAEDLYRPLVEPAGSVLIDDTPGEERLLLLDRYRGVFEFGRERRSLALRHEPARSGMALAMAYRPADGHVFVAYENLSIEGFEVMEIAPDGAVTTAFIGSGGWSISSMATAPDGRLLLAQTEYCEVLALRADGGQDWIGLPCDDWEDPILSLAASEGGLLASVGGATQAVLILDWSNLRVAAGKVTVSAPGLVTGKPEEFLVKSGSKLVHRKAGASVTSVRNYLSPVGLHLVADGLLVAYSNTDDHLLWYADIDWSARALLVRSLHLEHAARVGRDLYFAADGGLWRLDDRGTMSFVNNEVVITGMLATSGGDLIISSSAGDLHRFDMQDQVLGTLFEGSDHSINFIGGVIEHKGKLYFSLYETNENEEGLGVVNLDGSNPQIFLDDRFDEATFASYKERVCHTAWSDGIWCFNPSLPRGDDGAPGGWSQVTRNVAWFWYLSFTADGTLLASSDRALLEIRDREIFVLGNPSFHSIRSIVEEDSSGRIVVSYVSDDDREHGLAYIYR